MSKVVILIKTNQGGGWILPQVDELLSRGAEVVVVLPPGPGSLRGALDQRAVKVIESPFDFKFSSGFRAVRGLRALRQVLVNEAPEAVFYHLYASALAGRLSTVGLRLRRIHMVAGPLYLESRTIRTVERLLCRLDDVLIAGSAHTAGLYKNLGLPSKRLYTIPYGVDTERFRPGNDERARLLDVDDDAFVGVMLAYVYGPKKAVHRGVGIKGHETLVAAWRMFAARYPEEPKLLLIVGSGFDAHGEAYRQLLMERYRLAEDDSIRWIDTVNDPRPWYDSADVSISPSLSENHGAALEATAMGVPVIVSDAGGLPETTTPEIGWIVPAGEVEALADALENAFLAHRRGELRSRGAQARMFCESRFSYAVTIPRLASVVLAEVDGLRGRRGRGAGRSST